MTEAPWENAVAALAPGSWVAGVDEVGRGPLVGDVVAAAVVLGPGANVAGLRDSKALSARRREQLAGQLWDTAHSVSLGRATPAEIDRLNVLQASLLAMSRAVAGLSMVPSLVLVDGNRLPSLPCPGYAIVKGDQRVPEISAASIVAKVQRDREMLKLHRAYPGYGFDQHKGYPTALHLDALARLGPIAEHRRSFRPVREALTGESCE